MRNPRERIRNSRGYKWWILSLVMLGTFMAVMDVTVVNVGLPTIMSVFHIPISTAEWVITAYMITMTLMLPSAGWIADRIGNKRMYILGLVLFTFGSWLCGRAGSDMFLISARALQGFGSGIIQSLGLAIVTREFPPQQRGLALGLWSVAAAASISFGPLIGGYLVDDYSWHLIFDVNVPVGLAAILFAIFIQKEWRGARAGSFDWPGFLCVVCFMPLLIFALARGNSPLNPEGWSSPEVIGCFAVAAAALIVFIVRELRCENPLLNLKLLGERNFGVSMAVLAIFGIGMLGGTYLLPLYMQKGLGYTAIMAGSVFLPVGLIQGVLSTCSGFLTRYIKPLFHRRDRHPGHDVEFLFRQPVYSSYYACTNHVGTLSARFRHGTDLCPAERFLAHEFEPARYGFGGRHLQQHQTTLGQRQHRPAYRYSDRPYGVPFGAGRTLFGGKLRGRYLR